MKKEGILVIVLLVILISFVSQEKFLQERGFEEITTEGVLDTMATFLVSIQVDADAPSVIIDSPENRSYFSGNNIQLNYIITDTGDINSIWYNLDNGNNHTLTKNRTFNTDEGSHILYIFAEDIHGQLNNTEFISFFVGNPSEENIIDANGDCEFNDATIDEVIDKISNLHIGCKVNATLYNTTKPSDWVSPASTLVETVFQYFEISVNESTTGGSYTIFFNLSSVELGSSSASDVRLFIYEDTGWEELITTVIDSSSDPRSFSAITTHFSQFLIGEKATGEAVPTGEVVGGSETARGVKEKAPSFSIDQEFIKVLVKKGDILRRQIKISNTGNSALDFIIDLQELKNILYVSEQSFRLDKGEEKLIDLNVITGAGVAPGVYVGNILVKGGTEILKLIKTIIEIESEKILFDISLDIPLEYKKINPGEELILQSTLINMGGLSDVSVDIEYNIKNSRGEVILKDSEKVIVGGQASFTKRFLIPKDLPLGEYVITAVVNYKDSVGTSSETFNVGEKEKLLNALDIFLIAGILFFLVLMSLLQRRGLKNIEKLQKERLSKLEKEKPEMEESEVKKRLEKELKLLDESFEAGYITKAAYDKGKEKIKSLLK